jgi:hypothetical protein
MNCLLVATVNNSQLNNLIGKFILYISSTKIIFNLYKYKYINIYIYKIRKAHLMGISKTP